MRTILENEFVKIYEFEPCCRTIQYESDEGPVMFKRLNFPYQIFAFSDGCLYFGVRNKPICKSDSLIYFPNIANIFPNLLVCQKGSTNIRESLDIFWNTVFCFSSYLAHLASEFTTDTIYKWQQKSMSDVLEFSRTPICSVADFDNERGYFKFNGRLWKSPPEIFKSLQIFRLVLNDIEYTVRSAWRTDFYPTTSNSVEIFRTYDGDHNELPMATIVDD